MPVGVYKRTENMKTGKHMLGRKLSEETKEKITNSNYKRYQDNPNLKKQISNKLKSIGCKPPSFKGKKHSKKTREKISLLKIGEQNPNWQGGITPQSIRIRNSIEHRLWREAVYARDNWTCQKYGIKGGRLNPHHIKNFSQYPELRFAINNGITLSQKAHKEFHKKYGQRNNTIEQIKEFFNK